MRNKIAIKGCHEQSVLKRPEITSKPIFHFLEVNDNKFMTGCHEQSVLKRPEITSKPIFHFLEVNDNKLMKSCHEQSVLKRPAKQIYDALIMFESDAAVRLPKSDLARFIKKYGEMTYGMCQGK